MTIGWAVTATMPPPLLFADGQLSESVEVELGDLKGLFSTVAPPSLEGLAKQDLCESLSLPDAARVRSRSLQRSHKQRRREDYLQKFLQHHNLKSVDESVTLAGEEVYPIHLAAASGLYKILRLILNESVDPGQKTSLGRTALDMAKAQKRDVSTCEVLEILKYPVRTQSMRNFMRCSDSQLTTKHGYSKEVRLCASQVVEL